MYFHSVGNDAMLSFFISQAMGFLLYPLLGWLADVYFTRYKFVLFSFILMIVSSFLVIFPTALFLAFNHLRILFLPGAIAIICCIVSMGLFESTAIREAR